MKTHPLDPFKVIAKDPSKIQTKIYGKEFLLGKFFDLKACRKCKDPKFAKESKREKLLEIQESLEGRSIPQKSKSQNEMALPNSFTLQSPQMEHFLPLHGLWKSYIEDLVANEKTEESVCLKILRSDFVGAKIEVLYSKISSYIGHRGIIVKESLKSLVVVTEDTNKFIILLKHEIVFRMEAASKEYLINGNTLTYRPSDRSKHKFKSRACDRINLEFLEGFVGGQL